MLWKCLSQNMKIRFVFLSFFLFFCCHLLEITKIITGLFGENVHLEQNSDFHKFYLRFFIYTNRWKSCKPRSIKRLTRYVLSTVTSILNCAGDGKLLQRARSRVSPSYRDSSISAKGFFFFFKHFCYMKKIIC